jgi:flagellar hook-associated protein 1 FlgK
MSLSQALSISLSGLRTTQAGLALVAGNVANAQTPGYLRKTLAQETTFAGGVGGGVRVASVNRVIDEFVQRQLRVETSGGSYASLRAGLYERLQQVYGQPGSASAFETVFANFTNAVQQLATSPESAAARSIVLSSGQVVAQYFNGMTNDIQALRGDTENGLADAVASANNAMQKIATINSQIAHAPPGDVATAMLKDQRDLYVDQLTELMDIRVVVGDLNEYNVFTNSGVQLVGSQAAQLAFNPQGTVTAATRWSADPDKSTLGTLTLLAANGNAVDLLASDSIRSGQIAAYIEMRDRILVEAQDQLDAMAGAMAQALSSETSAGAAASSGAQTGYQIDTAGLLAGNAIHLTYTDNLTHQQRHVTIIRVDDPSALPLDNSATTDPNDEVIGVEFSAGLGSVAAQLNDRFNGTMQFDNPSGSHLRVLDDGAAGRTDIDGLSMTRTVTGLADGGNALAFFTDATTPYSGFITSTDTQTLGFAGRIAVNPALLGDPSKLVKFSASTEVGDPQRPNFIYQQLTGTAFTFSADTGIGTAGAPYSGDLPTYMRQILSMQGEAASNASSLSQGQSVVVNALKQRVADASGVNVDQEMAYLISLQTAYGANARVMSVVKDMIDTLLRM